MPWLPVNELRDLLTKLNLLNTHGNCPDCGAGPGKVHEEGCDVERCSACGGQRISCDCGGVHDRSFARWTGFWPGRSECLALGMVTRWEPEPGPLVAAGSLCRLPEADLNRFIAEGWYRLFWIKPSMHRHEHQNTVH